VHRAALEPLTLLHDPTPEAVTRFALRFLETPYLWGGVSAWGLDCSGLVGTVYRAFGVALPRDADQQSEWGQEVSPNEVRTADLLFFPGHVAITLDAERFVHANAHHMCVTADSFPGDAYGRRLREALTKAVRLV
jgi:cell wall-associated NlpC family hydrolase